MKTTAILFDRSDHVVLDHVEIPAPTGNELLLETFLTAISPGTELRIRAGRQAGLAFPVIPGYMNLARVIGRAPGAQPNIPDGTIVVSAGTRRASVACGFGAHSAHAVSDTVFPVPAGIHPSDAVLAKLSASPIAVDANVPRCFAGSRSLRHPTSAARACVCRCLDAPRA